MRVSDLLRRTHILPPPGQRRPGFTYRWARRAEATHEYREAPRRPADTAATHPAHTSTWSERRPPRRAPFWAR